MCQLLFHAIGLLVFSKVALALFPKFIYIHPQGLELVLKSSNLAQPEEIESVECDD